MKGFVIWLLQTDFEVNNNNKTFSNKTIANAWNEGKLIHWEQFSLLSRVILLWILSNRFFYEFNEFWVIDHELSCDKTSCWYFLTRLFPNNCTTQVTLICWPAISPPLTTRACFTKNLICEARYYMREGIFHLENDVYLKKIWGIEKYISK